MVGDIEPDKVFGFAEKYFAGIEKSKIKPIKPQSEIEQKGLRKTTVKLPAKLPYILMGYKVPVLNTIENELDAYALEVLAGILDGGNSARLASRLVRGEQIAISAGAGYNMASRLPDLFMLDATPAEGKTVLDLESALKKEIINLQNELVSDEELQRVKAQVLASAVYERDSNFYQAMQLGMLETVGIGWEKVDEYVEKVNLISAEQIRDVARKYLLENKLSIAYLDPQPIIKQKQKSRVVGGRHAR